MYLDPVKGFVLSTNAQGTTGSTNQITLDRVADLDNAGKTKPGFNVDLRYKANVGTDPAAYAAQNDDSTVKPILRLGASGALRDAEISVNAARPTLGRAQIGAATASSDMTGSTGVHVAMKASFTPDVKDSNGQVTAQGTRLELGAPEKQLCHRIWEPHAVTDPSGHCRRFEQSGTESEFGTNQFW